jgi:ribosomal protein S18 acetylase RimI-like enzyme
MSELNEFTIRPAVKSECRTIAELYRISSDGVAEYIWTKFAEPGEDLLDVGQRRYEQEDSVFSYRNCSMVDRKGKTAGMIIAFPEPASYYICGMAVFPEYRGRGIGTQLLTLAEKHAHGHGLSKLSLIVFEQNEGAKRLYERSGFYEKAHEPVVPHRLIHFDGRAVLMVKDLPDTPSDL